MSKPTDFNERIECYWRIEKEGKVELIPGTVSRTQFDYAKQDSSIMFYPLNPEHPIEKILVHITTLIFKKHEPVKEQSTSKSTVLVANYGLLRLQDSEDSRLLRDGIIRKVATLRLKDYQLYLPESFFYPLACFKLDSTMVVDIFELTRDNFNYLYKKESLRGLNLEILRMFLPDEGKVEVAIFTFKNGTFGLNLCEEKNEGKTGDYIIDRLTFLKKKAETLLGRTVL